MHRPQDSTEVKPGAARGIVQAAMKGDISSTKDAVAAQLGTEVVPRACREVARGSMGAAVSLLLFLTNFGSSEHG